MTAKKVLESNRLCLWLPVPSCIHSAVIQATLVGLGGPEEERTVMSGNWFFRLLPWEVTS